MYVHLADLSVCLYLTWLVERGLEGKLLLQQLAYCGASCSQAFLSLLLQLFALIKLWNRKLLLFPACQIFPKKEGKPCKLNGSTKFYKIYLGQNTFFLVQKHWAIKYTYIPARYQMDGQKNLKNVFEKEYNNNNVIILRLFVLSSWHRSYYYCPTQRK